MENCVGTGCVGKSFISNFSGMQAKMKLMIENLGGLTEIKEIKIKKYEGAIQKLSWKGGKFRQENREHQGKS